MPKISVSYGTCVKVTIVSVFTINTIFLAITELWPTAWFSSDESSDINQQMKKNVGERDFLINIGVPAINEYHPVVASLDDGSFAVMFQGAYSDPSGAYSAAYGGIYIATFDSLAKSLSNVSLIAIGENPHIAAKNSKFIAVWVYNLHIYAYSFDIFIGAKSKEVSVGPWELFNNSIDSSITILKNGDFIVVSDRLVPQQMSAQRFNSDGKLVKNIFPNEYIGFEYGGSSDIIELSSGDYVASWDYDSRGISAFHCTNNDVVVRIEFNVSRGEDWKRGKWVFYDPKLAALGKYGYVVVWQSDNGLGMDIYARWYTLKGVPRSAAVRVNAYTKGNQQNPDVAGFPDGSCVVVWEDDTRDNKIPSVFGQRFDQNGQRLGTEFQVNYGATHAHFPSITPLLNIGVIVVWNSSPKDRIIGKRILFSSKANSLHPAWPYLYIARVFLNSKNLLSITIKNQYQLLVNKLNSLLVANNNTIVANEIENVTRLYNSRRQINSLDVSHYKDSAADISQSESAQSITEIFQSTHVFINEVSQKFTYTFFKPLENDKHSLCLLNNCQPEPICEISVTLTSLPTQPLAYSSLKKGIYNLANEGNTVTVQGNCSLQQLEIAYNQTVVQLPDYEQQQWQQTLTNTYYQLSLTAGLSTTITASSLFAEDIALAQGYSSEAAVWFASGVRYTAQGAQMTYDIYQGANAMFAVLPLLTANAMYYGLTYSNVSNTAATMASTLTQYTTRAVTQGFLPTVCSFFASTAGSFVGSLIERKTADTLLSQKLQENFQKRLENFNEKTSAFYYALEEFAKQSSRVVADKLRGQIEPLIDDFYKNTANEMIPNFILYRQLCHVEEIIDECYSKMKFNYDCGNACSLNTSI